jgi:hypothetical protein
MRAKQLPFWNGGCHLHFASEFAYLKGISKATQLAQLFNTRSVF